jgi:hypothetical protein|nr:MAG TPA: hypothetical protein [Bacteriophage sp.]DAW92778.1 MAG TPA: hypothetical protein [Bacteriophage sp.]
MPKVIKKKILTEDDLLKFCQEQEFAKFSSKDTGYQLALKVPTTFEIDDTVDENHRGMMRLKFRIFHTGLNRNKSYVSKESAEKAMNTIADRPVLAAIHQLDDGSWDFEGHEMEIVKDEKGKEELRYIESQVGSFSSEPAFWEHDDNLDKDYVCAYAYISEEYTKACEIIRAKQGSKNSCELFIDELSYNAKEKYLELNDFYVNASTLLGSHDDGTEIQEGMEGSRADIADFSVNNNSVKFDKDEKMIELLENLNKTLSNFNKEQTPVQTQSEEGGTNNKMTKFEELLTKYGKTAEDVTFDYAEMSDEELEAKFAEMFDNDNSDGDNSDNGESGEPSNDGEGDGEGASDPDGDEEKNISKNELFNKLFEISFDEIRYALNNLCSVYRNDSEWCYVSQVYENYFIMEDWDSDKYYKQSYEKDGDNISLSGERIEMFAMLLTESEKLSIEDMRSNYSTLKEFKETAEKNELHAQKEAIINADNYSVLTEKDSDGNYVNADFAELVKTMDNYSIEDFETKVKVMHSDYMSAHANFSSVDTKKNTNSVKILTNMNKKSKPKKNYGNLFD